MSKKISHPILFSRICLLDNIQQEQCYQQTFSHSEQPWLYWSLEHLCTPQRPNHGNIIKNYIHILNFQISFVFDRQLYTYPILDLLTFPSPGTSSPVVLGRGITRFTTLPAKAVGLVDFHHRMKT